MSYILTVFKGFVDEQPDNNTAGFLVDLHRKDFTKEKALDFLRAHNDGVYKITASKHLDELVVWLLHYLERPTEGESQRPADCRHAFEEILRSLGLDPFLITNGEFLSSGDMMEIANQALSCEY